MCKRVYLTAKEAEREMQESRNVDGFTGKMETDYISRMIKDAKRNSMVGDKLQLVVDPMYIHIPEWQRRLKETDIMVSKNVIENMMMIYIDHKKILNEYKSNANTDSALVATKRSLIYNELSGELYKKFFLTHDEKQAAKDG